MLIIGATWDQISHALTVANEKFDGNLMFNRLDFDGYTRDKEEKYQVTLKVRDSRGPGAHMGVTGRHTAYACWHAHGYFMDALPSYCEIQALGRIIFPGEEWIDFSIGSMMYPMYASEACTCYNGWNPDTGTQEG